MTPDMVNVMNRINELQKRFGLRRERQDLKPFKEYVTEQKINNQTDRSTMQPQPKTADIATEDTIIKNLMNINPMLSEDVGQNSMLKERDIIMKEALKSYNQNRQSVTESFDIGLDRE
ncbi:MAG: hypothetical protein PF637_08780 [Spirochaetes bacterium]|jgi:hypothetical protein|nr:hypothetical protein [Spirochaetota bacterium]